VAAQDQAKVSDQWSYFQAKRIRGTNMLMTIRTLRSLTDTTEISPEAFQEAFEQLTRDLEQADQQAAKLSEAVQEGREALGSGAEPLQACVKELRDKLAGQRKEAYKLRDVVRKYLESPEKQAKGEKEPLPPRRDYFVYLESRKLPVSKDEVGSDGRDLPPSEVIKMEIMKIEGVQEEDKSKIRHAMKMIAGRAAPAELKKVVRTIPSEQIREALVKAEDRITLFDQTSEPVNRTVRGLVEQAGQLLAVARGFEKQTRRCLDKVTHEDKVTNDVRTPARQLADLAVSARDRSLALFNSANTSELDYEARRYDREARYNQETAYLYEVLVREAAFNSDTLKTRSQNVFYGMLAAQGGVTIATFALAMRKRSLLWGLASAAGLAALTIGTWSFLSV
jgi:hypothetical protein